MPEELQLVETDDQITHEVTLEDKLEPQVGAHPVPGAAGAAPRVSGMSCAVQLHPATRDCVLRGRSGKAQDRGV